MTALARNAAGPMICGDHTTISALLVALRTETASSFPAKDTQQWQERKAHLQRLLNHNRSHPGDWDVSSQEIDWYNLKE